MVHLTMYNSSIPLKSLHIALIDDEPDFLFLTEKFLCKFDKKVKIHSYPSPEDFLDQFKKKSFDIIVSDYEMPNLNGLDLLTEIRKYSSIPFIIFTGKSREEVVIRALNLGADFYVQKSTNIPLMYTDLYHHIIQAHEKNRAQLDLIESETKSLESQLFLSKLPIGLIISDKAGTILDGTDVYLKIVNMTKEELIRLTAEDIYYNPQHRKKFLDQMQRNGHVNDFNVAIKTKSNAAGEWIKKDVIASASKLTLQNNDYYLTIIKEEMD